MAISVCQVKVSAISVVRNGHNCLAVSALANCKKGSYHSAQSAMKLRYGPRNEIFTVPSLSLKENICKLYAAIKEET